MKEFDYYIFIDFSESLIGYNIIHKEKIKELLFKTKKFRHYRETRNKGLYIKNARNTFRKEKLQQYFIKGKIRNIRDNINIFMDVGEFIKKHSNCIILLSIDDKQYSAFEKFIEIIGGDNIKVLKESHLKKKTVEYSLSLVLDNWLNINRLKK